jgi:F0F1-type ATP synthase membrane subunit c/vacuolar-type H+-ATPase subunit K
MQPNAARPIDPQGRHRTLMIIWYAILANVFILYTLAISIGPDPSLLKTNHLLTIVLTAIGTLLMIASYFFRQKMLARAAEQQRAESVSSAYIVAFAMCEVSALCGLLLRFTTNERAYYFLFLMAICGLVLNMPRRDDVVNAVPGKQI